MLDLSLRHRDGPLALSGLDVSARRIDTALNNFLATTALQEFEVRFSRVIDLFEQVGIHPGRPKSVFNPYTRQESSESFSNIGELALPSAMLLHGLWKHWFKLVQSRRWRQRRL